MGIPIGVGVWDHLLHLVSRYIIFHVHCCILGMMQNVHMFCIYVNVCVCFLLLFFHVASMSMRVYSLDV